MEDLRLINIDLDNYVEIACLYERIIKAYESMTEKERKKFGDKMKFHEIIVIQLQNAHSYYSMSRFF